MKTPSWGTLKTQRKLFDHIVNHYYQKDNCEICETFDKVAEEMKFSLEDLRE